MTRILLVEDNMLSQKMMFYTFKAAGSSFDLAEDGFQAVSKSIEADYDVILMDINMPGIDGYQATGQIRENEAKNGRPRAFIIGLTGNVYDSERQKCIDAGMDGYMTKPFDMDEFKMTIEHAGLSLP